jgi:hypothetical protein
MRHDACQPERCGLRPPGCAQAPVISPRDDPPGRDLLAGQQPADLGNVLAHHSDRAVGQAHRCPELRTVAPVPRPSTNRPEESWASVAAWVARLSGVHIRAAGTTEMPVRSAVSCAQAAQMWNESGTPPAGVHRLSNPSRSASRAGPSGQENPSHNGIRRPSRRLVEMWQRTAPPKAPSTRE